MKNFLGVLHQMLEEKTAICPFCGAPVENIETWKYTNKYGKDYVLSNDKEMEYVKEINPTQYFCNACKNTWVLDTYGNAYSIDTTNEINGSNISLKKLKKEEANNSDVNTSTHGPNEYRIPLNFKYFWTPHMENDSSETCLKRKEKTTTDEFHVAIEKLIEASNKNKMVSTSKKQVIFDEGKYKIVRLNSKVTESKSSELSNLSNIPTKVDEDFGFCGKLVSFIEKSDNPFLLEQQISNYIKSTNSPNVEDMVEYLKEKHPVDAEGIQTLNEVLNLKKNKKVDEKENLPEKPHVGLKVNINGGYDGIIKKVHTGTLQGMVDVRLDSGLTCVSWSEVKKFHNKNTVKESINEDERIEVEYQWGLKNTWKSKIFKNQKEYEKWYDKNSENVGETKSRKYVG